MSESILNQTENKFTCIGTVYEKALKREEVTIDAGPKDAKKKVNTELISGPVSIRIPSGVVNFYLYVTKIGYNGKDNFQWKMAESAMDNWESEINGSGEEPTKVMIDGELNPRDYPDKSTGEPHYNIGFQIRSANTRVPDDAEMGMSIVTTAYVKGIKHEVKNEEETGRLIVNLLGVDYSGRCYPIDCIVEDGADTVENGDDDFEAFEVGQTRTSIGINYRIVSEAPKKDTSKKKTFGKKVGPDVHEGSKTSIEWVIHSADFEPIEAPDFTEDEDGNPIEDKSGYIDPTVMKKAIKVRAQMLEEMKNNPPEKKSGAKKNDFKARKAQVAKTATNKPPFDMDDDDDEDEDF